MDEHYHRFWKRYRAGRRWGNQHGHGRLAIRDGAECRCGARISQPDCDRWYAGVADGTIREHFGKWAATWLP